jgi:hypothetical protein
MAMGGHLHAPDALLPGKERRYPLTIRLCGPRGRSRRFGEKKIILLPGIEPRIVQTLV